MEQHLCAASGPAHVLFLLHPPVHQLVHSRLHPRCRYAMAFAVFPAAALESYTYVEPPIIGPIQAANFGSLIPTESRSLSPEICCHDITKPLATTCRSVSIVLRSRACRLTAPARSLLAVATTRLEPISAHHGLKKARTESAQGTLCRRNFY